jgi:hypothetical protein
MNDVLDTPLHDPDLLAEIRLVTELMAVATQADGPVPQPAIDAVLDVEPETDSR